MALSNKSVLLMLVVVVFPSCTKSDRSDAIVSQCARDNQLLFDKPSSNIIESPCSKDSSVCEFTLVISNTNTLEHVSPGSGGFPIRVRGDNYWLRKCRGGDCQITKSEFSNVVVGDGTYKNLNLYNETLPGPPMIVYKGQQVVVRLTNDLVNEATTMHFHGLHQRKTPWMDGTGHVSHCPINPGQSFTYRFLADQAGTYWYHSHHGTQRTMGAHGPLIVLERSKAEEHKTRVLDPLPDFHKEFYMMVSDYMHERSDVLSLKVKNNVEMAKGFFYGDEIPDEMCYNQTKQADGMDCGIMPYVSGVINGKGRYYPNRTDSALIPTLPLETFNVKKGKKYRFRVICTSMLFGFTISIDNHILNVVTMDGRHVTTKAVDSFMLHPGERLDFWIEASDPNKLGHYWIRAENLDYYQNDERIRPGHIEAILHYADSGPAGADPVSEKKTCTTENRCSVLNCPFKQYPANDNLTCIHMGELKASDLRPTIQPSSGHPFHEVFLNFHFASDMSDMWRSSVNGIQHVHPSAPPQVYLEDYQKHMTKCDDSTCKPDRSYCKCTHELQVPLGAVVQMVIATTVKNAVGVRHGITHPIHLHGTHFQVVKEGFPSYSKKNIYTEANKDFYCKDEACNHLAWTNNSWSDGGHIQGMKMAGAIEKDTVLAPIGGYVVVRFLADNPGFWFMHCHTEFHNVEGLALIVKVGDVSQMSPSPPNMAKCANFDWGSEEFEDIISGGQSKVQASLHNGSTFMAPPCNDAVYYRITSIVFAASTLTLLLACIFLWIKPRKFTTVVNGGYTLLSTAEPPSQQTSTEPLYKSYQSQQKVKETNELLHVKSNSYQSPSSR